MECNERQRLQQEWVTKHDRLCLTLEEYERKLTRLKQFDQLQRIANITRLACDRAREALDQHENEHGCSTVNLEG